MKAHANDKILHFLCPALTFYLSRSSQFPYTPSLSASFSLPRAQMEKLISARGPLASPPPPLILRVSDLPLRAPLLQWRRKSRSRGRGGTQTELLSFGAFSLFSLFPRASLPPTPKAGLVPQGSSLRTHARGQAGD